jgi:methylmalonyl-CoA mutase cobalamin-binding subunit
MASALLACRGYRVLYLGANTPVEQIAATARGDAVEAVAVSVSAATPRPRATQAVAQLRGALPRRVALWVGGAGAPASGKGIERFVTLGDLDARLAGAR